MKVAKLARIAAPVREPEKDWMPFAHWGKSPFADSDEIDGAKVGRLTLRRDPVTGAVVGFLDEPAKEAN